MYRLALLAALCLPALAHADDYQSRCVELEVTADGHANVIVAIKAAPEGGRVNIPIGAVFTVGGSDYQDVALGQPLQMDLEPGQRVELTLVAYCINRYRPAAPFGTPMRDAGMAPPNVTALLLERSSELVPSTRPERRFVQELPLFSRGGRAGTQEAVWEALGQLPKTGRGRRQRKG